jgi:hypothetical protein
MTSPTPSLGRRTDTCRGRPGLGPQGRRFGQTHAVLNTSFNRLLAPCPRRALTAGDSRPVGGSSGWPLPAQLGGPPRLIARIKLVPKLTVRVRFPSPAPCSNTVTAELYSRTSRLFLNSVSVLVRATLGHTYPHLGPHPSGSEDTQLVLSWGPAVCSPFTQGMSSPQL